MATLRQVQATEVYPEGWPAAPADFPNGVGRVVKVVIEGVEQAATITSVSNMGRTHLFLPDQNEYVEVEWS